MSEVRVRRPYGALVALLPATVVFACADLEADLNDGEVQQRENVRIVDGIVGEDVTFRVKATRDDAWVRVRLSDLAEADQTADWDVGFSRFNVMSNGGISGPGDVLVSAVPGGDFDEAAQAPETGWRRDEPKSGVDMQPDFITPTTAEFAFRVPNDASNNGWFDYSGAPSHTLSPSPVLFFVRATDGQFYKWAFLDYYDDVGTPAVLTVRIAPVSPPDRIELADPFERTDEVTIDASRDDAWAYVSLQTRGFVAINSPETSLSWDLAFRGTAIRTNSGPSGRGTGGAQWTDVPFDSIEAVNTVGFETDTTFVPAGPAPTEVVANPVATDWFDYDPDSGLVFPRDRVLLVRGADGVYAKLQVVSWADGTFTFRLGSVTAEAQTVTATLDASTPEWAAFDFDTGRVTAGGDWDLSALDVRLRTNSGTSGDGDGGARPAPVSDLSAITMVPADGFVPDEMLAAGDEAYSGNPVLADWFDGDPLQGPVSPKAGAFLVRTSSGDAVKLRITDFADGVLTFDYAFAGPGATEFP